MRHMVLARSLRPKKFSEFVGQEFIVKTLQSALKHKKIAQSYLFSGTRGVGKTSLARVFAKALRCENIKEGQVEPCLQCDSCLDIDAQNSMNYIEVDGASHNGVDQIRSLIESNQYLPSFGEYKIIVIDEVHMLSHSAFNALLKTLEEPSSHIIFILATTDPQKVPVTVLSRCQRFDLKELTEKQIQDYLKKITLQEGLSCEPSALQMLAQAARGSLRDALSLLEKALIFASESKNIDVQLIGELLAGVSQDDLEKLWQSLVQNDWQLCVEVFNKITRKNINFDFFSSQLIEYVYQKVNHAEVSSLKKYFYIYEVLVRDLEWVSSSMAPVRSLQVVFGKLILLHSHNDPKNYSKKSHSKPEMSSSLSKETKGQSYSSLENTKINKESYNDNKVKGELNHLASIEEKKHHKVENKETEKQELDDGSTVSWANFLKHVATHSKMMAHNLERVVIPEQFHLYEKSLHSSLVPFAFKEKDRIFFDYFSDNDQKLKLEKYLSDYLKRPLKINTTLLEPSDDSVLNDSKEFKQVKTDTQIDKSDDLNKSEMQMGPDKQNIDSFETQKVTLHEKAQRAHELKKQSQRHNLENNPYIKQAMNLFGSSPVKFELKDDDETS